MDLVHEAVEATKRYEDEKGLPFDWMKAAIAPYIKRIEELEKSTEHCKRQYTDEYKLRDDMTQEIRRALGISDDDHDTLTIDKIEELKECVQRHLSMNKQLGNACASMERERDSLKVKLDSSNQAVTTHANRSVILFAAALKALGFGPNEVPMIDGGIAYLDDIGVKRVADKLIAVSKTNGAAGFLRKHVENAVRNVFPHYDYTDDETLCRDMNRIADKTAAIIKSMRTMVSL